MTRTRIAARVATTTLAYAACLTTAACALHRKPPRPPAPATVAAEQWPEARRMALNAALARDFAGADSALRAFAARFPGTPPAAETVFWRALIRLDPTSEGPPSAEALRDVRSWLDAYVAGGPLQEHYVESVVLRRIATRLDSLRASAEPRPAVTVAVPAGPAVSAAGRDSAKARDDEILRLRTELDQAKAELERIRRRLAPPRP